MRGTHRKHPLRTAIVSAAGVAVVIGGLSLALFSSSTGKASAETWPTYGTTQTADPDGQCQPWMGDDHCQPPQGSNDGLCDVLGGHFLGYQCEQGPQLTLCLEHSLTKCDFSYPVGPPAHSPHTCLPYQVLFSFPRHGTVLTELVGPPLHNGEQATFQGHVYTITDVHGTTFSVTLGGHLVTNYGPAIYAGVANIACTA